MDIIHHLIKWGPHEDPSLVYSALHETLEVQIRDTYDYPGFRYAPRLIALYDPKVEEDGITLVPDHKSKRTSPMKPGRAIRKMFPHLVDRQVEHITGVLKNSFFVDTSKWAYGTTETPEGIGEVYMTPIGTQTTFYTDGDHKNLANSCMRYEFDHLNHHPASAWGSGDFVLHYVLDEDENLMARTLIRKKDNTRGPIYAVSQPAIDFLKRQIGDVEPSHDWSGAQLLALPYDDSHLIGPYSDVHPQRYKWDGHSELMTMSQSGNVSGDDHEGLLPYHQPRCAHCHEISHDREGGLCPECQDLDLQRCDATGDFHPADELITVYSEFIGNVRTHRYGPRAIEGMNTVVAIDGNRWRAVDCSRDHRNNWVPDHLLDNGTYTFNLDLQVFERA